MEERQLNPPQLGLHALSNTFLADFNGKKVAESSYLCFFAPS